MLKLPVNDLRAGMRFTDTLYYHKHSVLCPANAPVQQADIDRLKRWSIDEVWTEGVQAGEKPSAADAVNVRENLSKNDSDVFKNIVENKQRSAENYADLLEKTRFILTKVKNTKELDDAKVKAIYEGIMNEVTERKGIFLGILLNKSSYDYLVSHSLNVAVFATLMGIYMDYKPDRLYDLTTAALLHNIGMVNLPADITYRDEKLSERQMLFIKSHTLHGYKIIKDELKLGLDIADAGLQHHEYFKADGGYPKGTKGKEISEFARVIAVADVYAALITDREYRKAFNSYNALREIVSQSPERFDPDVVQIFVKVLSLYPVGTVVRLNNNCTGVVVESNDNNKLRPVVKLIQNETGDNVAKRNIIMNLVDEKKLYITEVVPDEDAGLLTDEKRR